MPAPAFSAGVNRVEMLPTWKETLNRQYQDLWALIAREMEAIARSLVPQPPGSPYATGELLATIRGRLIWPPRPTSPRSGAVLEWGTDHGHFVEYGTGRRGAATPQDEIPAGYRHGPTAGMEAQPFARPALHQVMSAHFGMTFGG